MLYSLAGLTIGYLALCVLVLQPTTSKAEPKSKSAKKPVWLEKRVLWTDSHVVGSPEPPLPFRITPTYPKLEFKQALFGIRQPGSDRYLVIQQDGKIFSFPQNQNTEKPELFFDAGRTTYSLCFHPRYEENGYIYVFTNGPIDGKNHNRISRFTVDLKGTQRPDPKSELKVLEYGSAGHNGHHLLFGPDGMLYISSGDGTSGMDPKLDAQNTSNLRGNILRIDVDHPAKDKPYSVPADNPFVKRKNTRPEIWAYGFRNPFRIQFDPASNNLWVADIGQDAYEMIHWVRKGMNAGWSIMEGAHPLNLERPRGPDPITPPIVEHPHAEMRSITGGYFYQGKKFPELKGAYLYGDYDTGKIFGVRYDYEKKKITWQQELADTSIRVLSIDPDNHGEPVIIDYGEGKLYTLERTPTDLPRPKFPRKLSETGIFADVSKHQVKPGVIPYSVNSPLWSDGAIKDRFIALPGDSKITRSGNKDWRGWRFQQGAVLVKSFSLEMEADNPESRRLIETRLLTLQAGPRDGEWVGYTYRWNEEQTDAFLIEKGGTDVTFTIRDAQAKGGTRQHVWHYPSRAECMSCHTREARYTLGLNTLQMNRTHDYGHGHHENQIEMLNRLGIFTNPLPKKRQEMARLVNPYDETQPLETRARSYLQANCAHCHVANGGGNSEMVLDFITAREKMNILDIAPRHQNLDVNKARLIAPGHPERSLLLQRAGRVGKGQMPPLGKSIVDGPALKMLRQWVASLQPEKDAGKP